MIVSPTEQRPSDRQADRLGCEVKSVPVHEEVGAR
jgi:hypothetical protein